MGFVENNLAPDETVICRAGVHWVILCGPLAILAYLYTLSVIIAVTVGIAIGENQAVVFVPMIFCLIPVVYITRKLVTYKCTEYVLTSKRVLVKTGLLRRSVVETSLSKIESINLEQSAFGRMLDYGNLTFVGTGGRGNALRMVKKPLEFRQKFQEQASTPVMEQQHSTAGAC